MVINRLFNWKNWADCKQIYKRKKYYYIELGEELLSIVAQMVPSPLKYMSASSSMESVNVSLFGTKAFADFIKLRTLR